MLSEPCSDLKAIVMKAVPPVSQLVPAVYKPEPLGVFGLKHALAMPVCWPVTYRQLLLLLLLLLLLGQVLLLFMLL
jgi:hypothetical protein